MLNYARIFVTIGLPSSCGTMAEKIGVFYDPSIETAIQVAKKIRKDFADNAGMHGFAWGTKFRPAQLYYIIYEGIDDVRPLSMSKNAVIPKRRVKER